MSTPVVTRADFQQLAEVRLQEAKALLDLGLWDGAYYLAGYAVEVALKACIIKKVMATDAFLEKKFSENCWTHDIEKLVVLAGLMPLWITATTADPILSANSPNHFKSNNMDHLWAPWRLAYITMPKEKPPTTGKDCFLCRCVAGASTEEDRANLVVHRTDLSLVVLNLFPYNNGHLLVTPKAHKARLDELTAEELLDIQFTLRKMVGILEKRMKPDGFNIGLNLGLAAGAGVPGHLHWHIVPRWNGDSNFMTAISDTRVLSQSLATLYDLLVEELAREGKN